MYLGEYLIVRNNCYQLTFISFMSNNFESISILIKHINSVFLILRNIYSFTDARNNEIFNPFSYTIYILTFCFVIMNNFSNC